MNKENINLIDDNTEINNNIEIDDNIKKPQFFNSKLRELDQRYNLIMNELSNNYKNNKSIKEDENNIKKLQNELFLLKNELLNNIDTLSYNIKQYDSQINIFTKENNILKKKFNEIKQKNNGSKGLAHDTQTLYNQYLMGNYLIGLVSLLSIVIYQNYFYN